jgi:hypothetical protein
VGESCRRIRILKRRLIYSNNECTINSRRRARRELEHVDGPEIERSAERERLCKCVCKEFEKQREKNVSGRRGRRVEL